MPKGSAWINFIYINVAFILQIIVLFYYVKIKEIKANWPKYRCNPMFMPLSDDMANDFIYCVQNMQTNFMSHLLQPITYMLTGLTSISGNLAGSVNNSRGMFSYMRTEITSIVGNIFGAFSNIVIEFQRISLATKDVISKMMAITLTLMYTLDGSIKTMRSMWNGPPGDSVRLIGSFASCFLPSTKVKLQDGTIRKMKDLHLGDILENGSKVHAVMKVGNLTNDMYYKIKGAGVNGTSIYVTGKHLMLDKTSGKFIPVEKHIDAIPMPNKKITWFSCLVTDNHQMQIRDKIFWDWEDQIYENMCDT